MADRSKASFWGLLVIGIVIGVVSLLAAGGAYRYTSSDEFCSTSCHSMQAYVAADPVFQKSRHRSPHTGIQIGCSDCHVPPTFPDNLIHKAKSGIRDIYQELANDFSQPGVWAARREDLAHRVRTWFIQNDSATCRSCHTPSKLRPKRESGQRQHELAERKGVTCIGCHFNIVHQPVKPTQRLIEYGRVSADMTRVAVKR